MLYLFVFRYYVTESGSRKGVPNLIFFFWTERLYYVECL